MDCRATPQEVKECLAKAEHIEKSRYYARFQIWSAAKSGGNAYAFPATEGRAFGYKIGGEMNIAIVGDDTAAGLSRTALGRAKKCDTNIAQEGLPNRGGEFLIFRAGLVVNTNSDALAVRELFPNMSVEAFYGTDPGYNFGPPVLMPGGGGVDGSGRSDAIAAAPGSTIGFMSNGFADHANLKDFGQRPLRWTNDGPYKDLTVAVRLDRATSVAGAAAGQAGAIVLDGLIVFDGIEISKLRG